MLLRRNNRSVTLRRVTDPNDAYLAREAKARIRIDRQLEAAGWLVQHDRIDADGKVTLRVNGRLHHIGIGRTHARTPVLLLVHDLHVRVVNAATGELLRELLIDPARDDQPIHPPRAKTTPPRTHPEGSGCCPSLERSHWWS